MGEHVTKPNRIQTIEVLYFDGCPNHQQLVARLPDLLEHEGITADIVLRNVPDLTAAAAERFLGSPTVRVNGRDIEPDASERTDFGLKCRIYKTETGLSGMPPDEWILTALNVDPSALR